MKIWYGYGSEHSANLVLIGNFKSTEDAKKIHSLIKELTDELQDKIDFEIPKDRYDDDVMDLLREKKCYSIEPFELEQFLYDMDFQLEGDKIILKTEELSISAFVKLMINGGAKIEIYSAHNYPDSKYGRGK